MNVNEAFARVLLPLVRVLPDGRYAFCGCEVEVAGGRVWLAFWDEDEVVVLEG